VIKQEPKTPVIAVAYEDRRCPKCGRVTTIKITEYAHWEIWDCPECGGRQEYKVR
jgi:ribosomal protein L37AE/L43A